MRIVLVNNFLYPWGGAEKVFVDQIDLFRKKGHEVFVFAQGHPLNREDESKEWFPPHNNGSGRSFLSDIHRFSRFIYSRSNRKVFRRFLEKTRPDLVHVHNISGGLTTSILDGARDAGVPVVLTLHDYKIISPSSNLLSGSAPCVECLKKPGKLSCVLRRCVKGNFWATLAHTLEFLFNRRFKKYDSVKLFIAPSRFLAEKFIQAGFDPNKLKVVSNTLDLKSYSPSLENGKYYFYAGRMSSEKGPEGMLRCFMKRDEELWLAGIGIELEGFKKMTKAHPNIRFLGQVGSVELIKYYRDCRAVIVPSICDENAPMAVLEAMACGKPVLASRLGGLPEMVEDGRTGFLFDPRDPEALKGLLDRFSLNPDQAVGLGRNARIAFEKKFTEDQSYEGLMAAYGDILARALRDAKKAPGVTHGSTTQGSVK